MKLGSLTVAASLLLICLGPAGADAPDTVFLEDLTWTELRDLTASKSVVIIVPVGGTEQNGPHMTLGKHNVRVKVLSEKIARRSERPRGPRDRLCARGRPQPGHRPHALPGDDHGFRRDVPESARVHGAELQAPRLQGHRLSRRPRVDASGSAGGGGAAQSRVGGDADPGARHRRVLSRRRRGVSAPLEARGYGTRSWAATPGSPILPSCSRWISAWCGPERRDPARPRPVACRGTRAGPAPSWASSGLI
jgi:Uncharacterized protein, putative amidase